MSETIDYKSLYELANVENLKLLEKNIELTKELKRLDKYESWFLCNAPNSMQMMFLHDEVEEIEQEQKRIKREKRKNIKKI
jgi:hypothetical protein